MPKKAKKITVKRESSFLASDVDWICMSTQDRGIHHSLMAFLEYSNGSLLYDIERLATLCNCDGLSFEAFWERYQHKFTVKDDYIISDVAIIKPIRSNKSLDSSKKYYPQDWQGSRWIKYNVSEHSNIPCFSGCYVLYDDTGRVFYVGSSKNVNGRIRVHFKDNFRIISDKMFIKIRFSTKHGDWAMRELRLIRRLKPMHNKNGVNYD